MKSYLWKINKKKFKKTNLALYSNFIEKKHKINFRSKYLNIWQWSVNNPKIFWKSIWDFTKVKGVSGKIILQESDVFFKNKFFPKAKLNDSQFLALAIRFGKALQLTNILRDLPGDLQQGRCYLPAIDLAAADLEPTDLLSPANWPKLKPVFIPWLTKANEHFAAAWQYTLMIPHEHYRLRLACAWPILMGKRTLHLLQTGNPLDPAIKRKISRQEVRGIIWSTVWRSPFRGPWSRLFGNK